MEIALFLIGLAVGVLVVTGVAERIGVPAPFVLIVVGAAASYLPGLPEVRLEPDVVLIGLLPPLLYAGAISTSLVEFNANRRPILLLSVGLVVFTTVGIGALVHTVVPGIAWPAALAIGAVVAPPDAVAALAIGRRVGLPRRVLTILEGESLLNDATALVALRTAIAAGAAGASVSALDVGLDFLLAAGGGVLVGGLLFLLVARVRRHVTDPAMDTAISFVVPFAAYVVAEELHASGVLAVVVAGLLLGHQAPVLQTAQSRIAERTNWRSVAFVLENVVFLLIGLQLRWILDDVQQSALPLGRIVAVCLLTLLAVILLRLLWVFPARYLLVRPGADSATGHKPGWASTFLLGWAGMRGVVTLAAAFVIPEDTEHREVLLLIAFTVVAGTLLVQGLSLPWFVRHLDVPVADPLEDALARASLLQQASKAGFAALKEAETDVLRDNPHGVVDAVKDRIERRNFAAWEQLNTTADEESPSELYSRLRLAMIAAERGRVLEVRSSGTVPSGVVSEVLAMLDVEESMLDVAQEVRDEERAAAFAGTGSGSCAHLETSPAVTTADDLVCDDCHPDERWVALRVCLTCGHVGCCDSSPHRHATEHFHDTAHPVMQSAEAGEQWRWCFVHHVTG